MISFYNNSYSEILHLQEMHPSFFRCFPELELEFNVQEKHNDRITVIFYANFFNQHNFYVFFQSCKMSKLILTIARICDSFLKIPLLADAYL